MHYMRKCGQKDIKVRLCRKNWMKNIDGEV